jgi:ribose transport system ATP-binding protein
VVEGISKSYGVVHALTPASLEVNRGEVHALVGENGSGKSTFVGIVSGTVRADTGTVTVNGRGLVRHAPSDAQNAGALTVFQDGSVIAGLSVAQNLYVGTPAAMRPSYGGMESWATERLERFGLGRLSAHAVAVDLSPADRQLLEIARAMMAQPAVLMLDEATSALDRSGEDVALAMMRQAADDGCAVLFVTHRLSEVFRVADRISILRDGVLQGTHLTADVDTGRLVEVMAGTSVDVEFPALATAEEIGEPLLVARALSGNGYGPVDLTVRRGELVGIAGADANGQLELLRGLAGIDIPGGSLEMNGKPIASFFEADDAGIGFLSSDRRSESLFASLSIRENLTVGVLDRLARWGVLSWKDEHAHVDRTISEFGIRVGSPEDLITSLSGGNQQKVALGRVLETHPEVLLIDEPTQGVDVRSRMDIYRMLRDIARHGIAVVLVSADASELAGICDRIVVMSRGAVVAELPGADATEEKIVSAFVGSERQHGDVEAASMQAPVAKVRRFTRDHQDSFRLMILVAVLVVIGAYAQSKNSTFLTTASLYNIFLTAFPLAVVAAGEFIIMFTGSIDVSIGSMMGLTVAVMSFVVTSGGLAQGLAEAIALAIGMGLVVGVTNATLAEKVRISPVIATIATLGILAGIGLIIRPTAAGSINSSLMTALTRQTWIFPTALLVCVGVFILLDVGLRRTGRGLRLRAAGLNPQFAYRLGVNAPMQRQMGYVGCAVLAALAGVVVAAQVGTGDSTVGSQYTLLAIAAPILGGASLLGGRGTFIGCLLGAVLLATAQTLPVTLSLNDGTSYYLTGGLTLLALLIYTQGSGSAVAMYFRQGWRTAARVQRTLPRASK